MNKIIKLLGKAAPIAKKAGPYVWGGLSGVADAFSKHKAEMRLKDMEDRIKMLEELTKKD